MPELIAVVVPSSPARVCAQSLIRALPQLGYIERCGMLMMVIMRPFAGDGVMVYTQSFVSQLFPNSGINDVAEAGKGEVDLRPKT